MYRDTNRTRRRRCIDLEGMTITTFSTLRWFYVVRVYTTMSKLIQRKISELQGLKMSILQCSYRESDASITITPTHVDTTNYNTFGKLIRRTFGELYNIKISIMENSYKVYRIVITLLPTHVNTTGYNTFSKLSRRKFGELYLLRISIIENSYRKFNASITSKVIKVVKVYKNKLKLIKQYVNKVKH